eukprot:1116315_1
MQYICACTHSFGGVIERESCLTTDIYVLDDTTAAASAFEDHKHHIQPIKIPLTEQHKPYLSNITNHIVTSTVEPQYTNNKWDPERSRSSSITGDIKQHSRSYLSSIFSSIILQYCMAFEQHYLCYLWLVLSEITLQHYIKFEQHSRPYFMVIFIHAL